MGARKSIQWTRRAAFASVRRHHPEQIDEAHDDDEAGDAHERCGRRASSVRESKQRERKRKVEDDQQNADPLPAAFQALHVPRNFVRQIARTR